MKTNKKIKVLPSWQFQKNKRRQNVVKKKLKRVFPYHHAESAFSYHLCTNHTQDKGLQLHGSF